MDNKVLEGVVHCIANKPAPYSGASVKFREMCIAFYSCGNAYTHKTLYDAECCEEGDTVRISDINIAERIFADTGSFPLAMIVSGISPIYNRLGTPWIETKFKDGEFHDYINGVRIDQAS